jgi:AraC-like DNA-binding protein
VFNTDAGGLSLRRSPRLARGSDEHRIALAVPLRGRCHFASGRRERAIDRRELFLVDLSAPYEFGWQGAGSSYAFQVDAEQLALPIDTINVAAEHLTKSPLYPMVRNHIITVTTTAERLVDDPSAFDIGSVTLELMRALIISAARQDDVPTATSSEALTAQILTFVSQHLTDEELTPDQVAAANNVSVRQLYKLLEQRQISLEQWIISHRLKGAHSDLAAPNGARMPISALARRWGFSSPSFFSSRFRQRYGMSPQQWRSQCHPL